MLCEYCHAMGNGPGDLMAYKQLMDRYPTFIGAFVWEWCDHAVVMGQTHEGKNIYGYGGDSGEALHDKNFCMDGLVYPDRVPHVGLKEYQQIHRPITATEINIENKTLTIQSNLHFLTLSSLVYLYIEQIQNGKVINEYQVEIEYLEPQGTIELSLPFEFDLSVREDVRIHYYWSKNWLLYRQDQLIASEQIQVNTLDYQLEVWSGKTQHHWTIEETFSMYKVISTKGLSFTFDRVNGQLVSFIAEGSEQLVKPTNWSIWRAPTDNDQFIKEKWFEVGFDQVQNKVYQTLLTENDQTITIKCHSSLAPIYRRKIVDIHANWIIHKKTGQLQIQANIEKNPLVPSLPRFGLQLTLPPKSDFVKYVGMGPNESYQDKHWSSYFGTFETSIDDLFEDYIYPQENGSHSGTRLLSIYDERQEIIVVSEKEFSFNYSCFSPQTLTKTAHRHELLPDAYYTLMLDSDHAGVGSNSCGPILADEFQVSSPKLEFDVTIGVSKK